MTTAAELLPIFRDEFPEFDAVPDETILKYLNNALLIHAICPMATVYLAAHLYSLDQDSGIGSDPGPSNPVDGGGVREVTSERAKNITATFKSQSDKGSDSFYTTTPYGRMYLVLRDACPGRGFSVRVY